MSLDPGLISQSFGIPRGKGGGGSTHYEIYIGFCPRIDFHNIMHIDCLTYDYSICDIVFLLPIYMVKNEMLCNRVSDYWGIFSLSSP